LALAYPRMQYPLILPLIISLIAGTLTVFLASFFQAPLLTTLILAGLVVGMVVGFYTGCVVVNPLQGLIIAFLNTAIINLLMAFFGVGATLQELFTNFITTFGTATIILMIFHYLTMLTPRACKIIK